MDRRAVVIWAFLSLGASICAAQGPQQQGKPKAFTIGRETTVVDGPVNPDGTIDYCAVINKLLGEGVKNEENAALLLLVTETGEDAKRDAIFKALKAPPLGGDSPRLNFSESFFMKKMNQTDLPPAEYSKLSDAEKGTREKPWKVADYPELAAWFKANEKSLAMVENASKLPRFYIPFVSTKSPPTALDGLPLLGGLLSISNAVACRAMMRAGEGDFEGSLDDLRCMRRIVRLEDQEHMDISHLLALAQEMACFRGYAGLAVSGGLNREQLQKLRKEITSLPPLPQVDSTTSRVEEMIALDQVMICIRGDAQHLLQLSALSFDQSKRIDEGDLSRTDWDVALRQVVHVAEMERPPVELAYATRVSMVDKMEPAAEKPPVSLFEEGSAVPANENVEKFLKMRDGETREEFSRRIGRWLCGWDPAQEKAMIFLNARPLVTQNMALLAVLLAEYRLDHGAYPQSLKLLGNGLPQDYFSGKDFCYRRADDGFVLWSVGKNQKDDDAAGDDLVIKAEK